MNRKKCDHIFAINCQKRSSNFFETRNYYYFDPKKRRKPVQNEKKVVVICAERANAYTSMAASMLSAGREVAAAGTGEGLQKRRRPGRERVYKKGGNWVLLCAIINVNI